jgi:hypothetical protein
MKTITRPRKGIASNPFMRSNEFLAKLRTLSTLDDKRCHIVEANPLFYCLGTKLDPRNPYEGEQHGQT